MFLQVCLFLLLIIKCYSYQSSCCYEYNRYRIPQDVMVDVVNNLAIKLLAIHNENNDNNIAISPYGVVSVLVALTEGVQGSAANEIHRAAGIPTDLSVIRIGLRDIHRHLKSYFIPEEGFLSGLTFSHDNVTLNREYEEILRFYGFDINSFNNALYPDFTTTESTSVTEMSTIEGVAETLSTTVTATAASTTQDTTEKITETTALLSAKTESTTEKAETTTSFSSTTAEMPETEQINEMTSTLVTTTETGLTSDSSRSTRSETFSTTTATEKTTNAATTTVTLEETTTQLNTEITSQNSDSTSVTSMLPSTLITTTLLSTSTNAEERSEMSTVAQSTTEINSSINAELLEPNETSTTTAEVTSASSVTTEMLTTTNQLGDFDATTEGETTSTTNPNDSTTNMIILNNETSEYLDESKKRNTRSVVDYIIARYYDDRVITQRPPPYNSENNLYFLINGKYKESNINYMTYDTVLPFHYLSHLDALALRFPLDSSKYYLLLLLPQNPQQLNKLICNLRLNSNLKYIIDNLKYTHVKAIIPSFMLRGYVVLTTTLQKMGINRVFEPRQADFSSMTTDKSIYVTNIEQAITVNIRNYVDPATMSNNRYLTRSEPVLFKADHPFLYFVIDSEIDVTLMAGKIVNPLNSRIR